MTSAPLKFCRFTHSNSSQAPRPHYGLLESDCVQQITAAPWTAWTRTEHRWPLGHCRLLAPVEPSKIVCVGRNYAAHAAELGNDVPKEPLIFLKPSTSIVGPDEAIVLPQYSQQVEHEGELGVVIVKRCSHLNDSDDPFAYVLGYTCVNDVTARDLQKSDVQFTRAKGFDTFCPIGPHIVSNGLDPADTLVETTVNGEKRQSSNTSLMVYPVAYLIRWISRMMTLLPGDVIATGTPAGVGPLLAGDSVSVSVAGVGVLRNPVHAPIA
jgi:2-keto-4-pentenoate hydratase/2-oxohepta-3-ene-1,7-dioic acid hydratase in catechol pathway